jgi:hypothetical protein
MNTDWKWKLNSYNRRYKYFVRIKTIAKKDGVPFNLGLQEMTNLVRECCARCGGVDVVELELLDTLVGYERENLRTICRLCQRLVRELGSVGLLDYAQRVARSGVK